MCFQTVSSVQTCIVHISFQQSFTRAPCDSPMTLTDHLRQLAQEKTPIVIPFHKSHVPFARLSNIDHGPPGRCPNHCRGPPATLRPRRAERWRVASSLDKCVATQVSRSSFFVKGFVNSSSRSGLCLVSGEASDWDLLSKSAITSFTRANGGTKLHHSRETGGETVLLLGETPHCRRHGVHSGICRCARTGERACLGQQIRVSLL